MEAIIDPGGRAGCVCFHNRPINESPHQSPSNLVICTVFAPGNLVSGLVPGVL
jgi:hypothetical protein